MYFKILKKDDDFHYLIFIFYVLAEIVVIDILYLLY